MVCATRTVASTRDHLRPNRILIIMFLPHTSNEIFVQYACIQFGDQGAQENTTTTDPVMCPTDLCWDGSSRDPADCSCPPETGSNTSTDQDNLGNEVAEPAFVPGFSMVTATIGLVLGAIVIATRRSEDSQTSHPSRPDNGS